MTTASTSGPGAVGDLTSAIEAAERWAIHDPEPRFRSQIDRLVDDRSAQLIDLFNGRIAFGTAGLRAAVGPGPTRMNALVVRQATVGVVSVLRHSGIESPTVVVGFDARHDSADFARHVAAAVVAAGGHVQLADASGPTLRLVAATHWAQLHREAAIAATETFRAAGETAPAGSQIAIVYTPMHGVGGQATLEAFAEAGLAPPLITESQFDPDPDFPTVGFPNPEEPGALDRALAVADEHHADAVFAHDPDADRLAIAVRGRRMAQSDANPLVPLSGDQLGILLGDFLIRHSSGDRLVARSVVSSRMLDVIAAAAGVTCVATLTGFKWIARAIDRHPDHTWLFGYEEAIGYSVGSHVRDKDGITAALVAHAALTELAAQERTVWDRFDELAAAHGVYESRPVTLRFDDDPSAIGPMVERLVSDPPTMLGGSRVAAGPIGGGTLPATAGVELLAQDQTRVIVRPSGTEPKVKAYVEVIEPVGSAGVAAARADAQARLANVCDEVRLLLSAS